MANGTFPIKQLYDEEGNPYYPITHIDLINGGKKSELEKIGSTIRIVDLSDYLLIPYTGSFELRILNNLIFVYSGIISNTESADPIDYDKEVIIARDIPALYRSSYQLIHCNVVGGTNDRINAWISNTGELIVRITPRCVYKDDIFLEDYKSSIGTIRINGLYFKTGMEDI